MKYIIILLLITTTVNMYSQVRIYEQGAAQFEFCNFDFSNKNDNKLQSSNTISVDIFPFRLDFIEDTLYPKTGFFDTTKINNTTKGEKYRNAVCAVFRDLSVLFDKAFLEDTCIIRIMQYSWQNSEYSYVFGSPVLLQYSSNSSTLIENAVAKTLICGRSPYNIFVNKLPYNGTLYYNFHKEWETNVLNKTFNYEIDSTYFFTKRDLYSYTLKEIFILLGCFSSFSELNSTNISLGIERISFAFFDKHLCVINENDTIPILDSENLLNYQIANKILKYPDSYNIRYKTKDKYLPIRCNGSECDSSPDNILTDDSIDSLYILSYNDIQNGKYRRIPHQDEINILQSLGYRLTDEFGYKENPLRYKLYVKNDAQNNIIGRDDSLSINWGDTVKLSIRDLLKNDINADTAIDFKVLSYSYERYPGKVFVLDDTMNYIPSLQNSSYVFLSYLPVNQTDTGNIAFVHIKLKYSQINTNTNDCNVLLYGGFENYQRAGRNLDQYSIFLENKEYSRGFWARYDYYLFDKENFTNNVWKSKKIESNTLIASNNHSYTYFQRFYFFVYYFILRNSKLEYSSIQEAGYDNVQETFPFLLKNTHLTIGHAISYYVNNPDTWDEDFISNNIYLRLRHPMTLIPISPIILYQKIEIPLDTNKQYVVDFFINIRRSLIECTKYCHKIKFYLDFDDPLVTNSAKDSFSLSDKQQWYKLDSIPTMKWVQWKTQPFKPRSNMDYFVIGDMMDTNTFNYFSYLFDDIRLRPVGTSVNTYCNNYAPCLGDEVTFTFDVWKDIPTDSSLLVLEDLLPNGFRYISGDFEYLNNKLICTINRSDMDSSGRKNIYLTALVEELPTDTNLVTNKIVLNGDDECPNKIGKTEVKLRPAIKQFEITKEIDGDLFCDLDTFKVRITVKNISGQEMKDFTLKEKTYQTYIIPTELVTINGHSAIEQDIYCVNQSDRFTQNFSYGNHIQEFILLSDYTLPYNPNSAEPDLVIEYSGVLKRQYEYYGWGLELPRDTIRTSILAGSQNEGCNYYKYETRPVFQGIELPFDNFVHSCGSFTLDAKNPGCKYLWSTGDTTQTIFIQRNSLESAWVRITNPNGCTMSDTAKSISFDTPVTFSLSLDTLYGESGDTLTVHLDRDISYTNLNIKGQIICDKELLEPIDKKHYYDEFKISEDDSTYIIDFADVFNTPGYTKILFFKMKNPDIPQGKIYIRNFYFTDCDNSIIANDTSYCILSNSLPNTTRIFDSTKTEILSNYPNPFSESTKIYFNVDKSSSILLELYDVLGNKVETLLEAKAKPGKYEFEYKPKKISQGNYFIVYTAKGEIYSRKILYRK